MPIHDVSAQNKSLDDDYGASHASSAPASHTLHLFYADPMTVSDPTTVELDSTNDPGYAPATINNDATWAGASGGQKALAAGSVALAAPTAAWLHAATHYGLKGADGLWWDCAPLSVPLVITSAGPAPSVAPVIFYAPTI